VVKNEHLYRIGLGSMELSRIGRIVCGSIPFLENCTIKTPSIRPPSSAARTLSILHLDVPHHLALSV
jgi:hypothetical protein